MSWYSSIRNRARRHALLLAVLLVTLSGGMTLYGVTQPAKKAHHRPVKRSKKKAAKKVVPPPTPQGPAAGIALAKRDIEAGNFAAAVKDADAASARAPQVNDYAQYFRAQAEYKLKDYPAVAKAATQIFNQQPISPLTGKAAAIAVNAELDSDNPKHAFELVKKYFDKIPDPEGTLLLARCFQANGDLAQAAEYFQRVYYGSPNSKEANDAGTALADLKNRLGDSYPPVMPAAMLGRADKLLNAQRLSDARTELTAAIPQLGGVERDQARVRLGEIDYQSGKISDAFQYFKDLKVDDSEADAERQAYLARCARKLDKKSDVKEYLNELEQHHPSSQWRLDALINVADQARAENDSATYLPLYRACAAGFGKNPRAAWCSWRAAFNAYRGDDADAYDLLLNYIKLFPDSPDTSNALYFLGRLSEHKNDGGAARACYDQLVALLPNTYYAILAQGRLKTPEIKGASADPQMVAALHAVTWPPREQFPSFSPGPIVQKRLVRAQLLETTGLNDFAEDELKFGSLNEEGQQNVYAYELAKLAMNRGAPDEALRYIKTFAPGYLYMPLDQAPLEFWRVAFPFPFRDSIEESSRVEGLDPFLVAALIRQESGFNTRSISHAHAVGLMQVLPSTGKQLARHFGMRRFSSADLLTADRNIRLGTYFFKTLLDASGGEPEIALASYNAGPNRSAVWRTWGPFHEPAEFTETVPFHETRGYIQVVLRNADVYRRLYAGTRPDIAVYHSKPAPKAVPVKKRPKTKAKLHHKKPRHR